MTLPNRRLNATREATVGGVKCFCTVGFDADGEPAELFVDVAPTDADDSTRAWASCWSRAVSLAIQAGADLGQIIDHFRYSDFRPSGRVDPPQPMHFARSIVDWAIAVLDEERP